MSGRHRRSAPVELREPRASVAPASADAAPVGPAPASETAAGETPADPRTYVGAPAPTVLGQPAGPGHRGGSRRTKVVVGVGAVLVLAAALAAGLVAAVVLRGSDPPDPRQGAHPAAARPAAQQTLLLQVAGADGTAAASALVGTTPSREQGAALLVPSRLLVDVASAGNLPFGEALTVQSPNASSDALTDLLGVRVQDHWLLTPTGLAALVDQLGGVQAQVDVDVTRTDADGKVTVVVPAGSQTVAGPAAAAYATFLGEDEPEQARLARFNDVLDGVLRSLPVAPDAIAADLAALGTGSSSSLTGPRLAQYLTTLRTIAVADGVRYDVLPVNAIDTGSSIDTYGVDSAKAGPLLESRFAASLLRDPSGDDVRVLVENGVGTPDLVEKARGKLVASGFRFVNGGNAATLDSAATSLVLVADGSSRSQARGARVATSLGLPPTAIEINPRGQTVADVIVLLGADFRP